MVESMLAVISAVVSLFSFLCIEYVFARIRKSKTTKLASVGGQIAFLRIFFCIMFAVNLVISTCYVTCGLVSGNRYIYTCAVLGIISGFGAMLTIRDTNKMVYTGVSKKQEKINKKRELCGKQINKKDSRDEVTNKVLSNINGVFGVVCIAVICIAKFM